MQNETLQSLSATVERSSETSKYKSVTFSQFITISSLSIIILAEMIATIGATDWALITLFGLPDWAGWTLGVLSAVAALYATVVVVRMAITSERNLVQD